MPPHSELTNAAKNFRQGDYVKDTQGRYARIDNVVLRYLFVTLIENDAKDRWPASNVTSASKEEVENAKLMRAKSEKMIRSVT